MSRLIKYLLIFGFLQALLLTGSGTISSFFGLLAEPEPDDKDDTQSLIFLWRYYEMTNDSNAKVVFDKGINYLKENLWRYDTGSWSSYDLLENLATAEYHKAQISQLEELYDITGENVFKVYTDRFEKYLKPMPLDEQ
ncbi:MAG: D-glucuronyl C5-epimerase family protein [Nitrososphaeraceae archaeon]